MTNQTNNEKSKNGKRLALILVALLLIAAVAFGAFTYSRYISEINGTGSATVAKWGYTLTIGDGTENEDMGFSQFYGSQGTEVEGNTAAVIAGVTNDKNVVAPGAKGSVTFTVGGEAEVNAKITYALSAVGEAEDISDVSLTLKNGDASVTYKPIKWTLNDGETNVVDAETLDDVQEYLEGLTKEIKAGTELTATTYTLSWAWAFDNETPVTAGDSTLDCDALDTLLGKLAAQSQPVSDFSDYTAKDASGDDWIVTGYSINVGFALSITIEQINTVVA
ncbi:MAG TPA: hypothetical protein IAB69_03430 [Candidatus Coproplasma excrementigallinarum]|uniref:Uncharacterized protein n=1 Tax=Candidatus Coproplasma excrementigallinarum TaxID=2840747 RepID=A0A9D1MKB2_9FIRM|nr:hypothetical protein [Candidatus Coproplasma excrementigallinarum]